VLLVEHDKPAAAVGPLLIQVDPAGKESPVEVDVVGAKEATRQRNYIDQTTQVARIYVKKIVTLDQLIC